METGDDAAYPDVLGVVAFNVGLISMITAGCILQAHHRLPESAEVSNLDLGKPEDMQKLLQWGELYDRAHIVTIRLSKDQAERIRGRLWPNEDLLGATSGRGFSIETPEQVMAVNEILQPEICITFSQEHIWMLQTWPVVVND